MNDSRGAKGGKNDRKRALKIKRFFLKKLKEMNIKKKLPSHIKNLNIINLNYTNRNVLVEGYNKVKIIKPRKENKIFDGIIMITSLLTLLVPEKTTIKKEKTKEEKKLEKIEEAKIVENYSNQLKDLRTDLREKSFEQKLLNIDEEETKQVDITVEKLGDLIDKVDDLEEKISSPENEKYNSDYLYVIVDEYLEDYKNNKDVEEITSSPLFIDISNKIEEIVDKKELIDEKINLRKEELDIDDKKMSRLKAEYDKNNKFNDELYEFTKEADRRVEEIKDKLDKQNIEEEINIRVRHANRLLNMMMVIIAAQMLTNTRRNNTNVIVASAIILLLLRRTLNRDRRITDVNITRTIENYSKEIEKEISSIDDMLRNLNNSLNNIDSLIIQLETEFYDYRYSDEYKELMSNLERLKRDLNEKKHELNKQKKEEENNLTKNNAKVKTIYM